MCRILFKENNINLFDINELEESYKFNSDGTGVIYFDPRDCKLKVKKFIKGTPFEKIYKYIKSVEQNPNYKNIAVHFRFGTGGGLGIDQIHPIEIRDNMYLIHNGCSGTFDISNATASDTQWMARWLKNNNFCLNVLNDENNKKIYDNIFSGNKLLIMEGDKYKFVNEDLGRWDKGIWKSWQDNSKYGWYQNYETEFDNSKKQLSIFDYPRYDEAKINNDAKENKPTSNSFKDFNKIYEKFKELAEAMPTDGDIDTFEEIMLKINKNNSLSQEQKMYFENELTDIQFKAEEFTNQIHRVGEKMEDILFDLEFSSDKENEDEGMEM